MELLAMIFLIDDVSCDPLRDLSTFGVPTAEAK
jgi:hypothetical protein